MKRLQYTSHDNILAELERVGLSISKRTLNSWIESFRVSFPNFLKLAKLAESHETNQEYYLPEHIEWLKVAIAEQSQHSPGKDQNKQKIIADIKEEGGFTPTTKYEILFGGLPTEPETITPHEETIVLASTEIDYGKALTTQEPAAITSSQIKVLESRSLCISEAMLQAVQSHIEACTHRFVGATVTIEVHRRLQEWALDPTFCTSLEEISDLIGDRGLDPDAEVLQYNNYLFYKYPQDGQLENYYGVIAIPTQKPSAEALISQLTKKAPTEDYFDQGGINGKSLDVAFAS